MSSSLKLPRDEWQDPGRVVLVPDSHLGPTRDPILFTQTIDNILASRPQVVMFLGDLVNDSTPESWGMLQTQVGRLTSAGILWIPATGNHDYLPLTDRTTLINSYLSVPAWFSGVYQPGHIENSYSMVTLGRRTWLLLSLEWSPRTAVVAWANSVVQAHPTTPVILCTHCYLYYDGTRYNWTVYGDTQSGSPYSTDLRTTPAEGISDGEDLWNNLVRGNSNIQIVVCGHSGNPSGVLPTEACLSSIRTDKTTCYQILRNYQDTVPWGGGCLVNLRLDYANHRLSTSTYDPYFEDWILTNATNISLSLWD